MACIHIYNGIEYQSEEAFKAFLQKEHSKKTLRLQELQSDLFQKGRDKEDLIKAYDKSDDWQSAYHRELTDLSEARQNGYITGAEYKTELAKIEAMTTSKWGSKENQFLQLLNKDNNWVTFFVKSIVQDSAKKGYEKVLFPTGDIASKVEGHETLEQFKKQKEDRIKYLENTRKDYGKLTVAQDSDIGGTFYRVESSNEGILRGSYRTEQDAKDRISDLNPDREIAQLQEELKRVDSEGFGALKPIHRFYEETVGNILKKQYGKDNVERITDEYGNGWYQVPVQAWRDLSHIYFQQSKTLKDGIKQEFRDLSRRKDNIWSAYRIFRGAKTNGRKILSANAGVLENTGENWSKILRGTLGIKQDYLEGLEQFPFVSKEHEVYFKGDKVIKVNKLPTGDILGYLQRIIIHNYLFPESSYNLVGFLNRDGNILPVVEQDRFSETQDFNLLPIGNYLSSKYGMKQGIDSNTFVNNEVGVGVSDITPGNVFIDNNKFYFVDPFILIRSDLREGIDTTDNSYQYQLPAGLEIYSEPSDSGLDAKIEAFVRSLGGFINHRGQIIIDGKVIDANAVADVINRTIEVADSKASIDTLPEEAAHIYIEWLPEDSPLMADMMADIRKRDIYQQVMDEYSGNPHYQNADGTVNEDKIAKEAIGKLIAGTIVGQYKDAKAKGFWKRLWTIIKQLFTGKNFNSYEVAASDILTGNLSRLELDAARAANRRGEYYFQLSDKDQEYIDKVVESATDGQKEVVDKVYLNPQNRVVLHEGTHTYTDTKGDVYTSTTSLINGTFENDEDYIQNRDWGNDFDAILQGIALGKTLEQLRGDVHHIPADMAESAYNVLKNLHQELTADGSIVIPQVVVADSQSRVAGSIDLLVIHPEGDTTILDLKTYRSDRPLTNAYPPGPGSVFYNSEIETLSKQQKHGIQVATYKKLLALMGFPNSAIGIKYIQLDITGSKKQQELHGFTEGDLVPLSDTSFTTYADRLVFTPWEGRDVLAELALEGGMTVEEARESAVEEQELVDKAVATLKARSIQLFQTSEDWRNSLEKLKDKISSLNSDTFYNMDSILNDMELSITNGKDYGQAYRVFLVAAEKQLTRFKDYLTTKDTDGKLVNMTKSDGTANPEFLKVAELANKYIQQFQGLIHIENFHRDVLTTKAEEQSLHAVQALIYEVGDIYSTIQKLSAAGVITDNITGKQVEGVLAERFVEIDRDITSGREWMGSLGGTMLFEALAKDITNGRETGRIRGEERAETILSAGNKLKAAGVDNYDFMTVIDKDGKRTGERISEVGTAYRAKKDKVEAPLINDDGTYKEYSTVKDLKTADPKMVTANIELWNLKQAKVEFMKAEKILYNDKGDATGTEDGDYHYYTDEFKADRAKYMRLNNYGKWIPKALTDEFITWRRDHMTYQPYTSMVFKDGKPTGQTKKVEGNSAWFFKDQFIKRREIAADGTRLVDDKYYTLMNPKTDKERAQADYFRVYNEIINDLAKKLPVQVMAWVEKALIPGLRGNFLELMGQKDINLGALLTSQVKDTFSVTAHTNTNPNPNNRSLPLMFITQLQDPQKLARLNSDMDTLIAKKSSMKFADYDKAFTDLRHAIKEEQGKLKGTDIHPDLTVGLEAFAKMAENFIAMSDIEDKILLVEKQVEQMKFTQEKTVLGKTIKKEVKGIESRANRKLKQWIEVNYYNDPSFTKGMAELVVKRLQNLTSTINIAGNITGMINNGFIASLNNSIDSFGHDFWAPKTYRKAVKRYHTDFIPGFVKTFSEHSMRDKKDTKYDKKKAGSKYEALAHKYNMVKHQVNEGSGKVGWLAKLGFFSGYEAGEFMVQSEVGIAIVDSIMLKNSITGEECSLYDAHEFNKNTGHVELRKGFSQSLKEQTAVTHRIWKTNERIHGNYDAKEKVMLEKYWLGQLALQFHKWVFPNFQIRFQRNQYEAGLGEGMEVEGRYITLGHLLKNIVRAGINVDKQKDAWATLSKHQRNNLLKDLADAVYISILFAAGFVIKSLAKGIPDDDPYLKKMANYLQYQSDRGIQELSLFIPAWGEVEAYQLFKNPFAVTSSLQKFALILQDAVEYPFVDDEDRYYQRGPFKGQLKLKKVFYDVTPGAREINQWILLDTKKNFYVR